jgi:hypothetical protein
MVIRVLVPPSLCVLQVKRRGFWILFEMLVIFSEVVVNKGVQNTKYYAEVESTYTTTVP